MSRYGYTTEEQNKAAENLISDYEYLATLYRELVPVLERFDGKVFNCRLEKAIQEATKKRIYCRNNGHCIDVYAYTPNFNQMRTICAVKTPENKRIIADEWMQNARERREGFLKAAEQLRQAMPRIDTIKEQIKQLTKALDGITGGLSYEIQDIYGLHYHIRNY